MRKGVVGCGIILMLVMSLTGAGHAQKEQLDIKQAGIDLEQAFDNLDYIWKIKKHTGDTVAEYLEAHNNFIEAYRRYPVFVLPGYFYLKAPRTGEVSQEITDALKPLKDRRFMRRNDFWDAVKKLLGKKAATKYKDPILKYSRLLFRAKSMEEEYGVKFVVSNTVQQKPILNEKDDKPVALIPDAASETFYEYLNKSKAASRKILSRYYFQTFADNTKNIKADLLDVVKEEPDSAMDDFIPVVEKILAYFEDIGQSDDIPNQSDNTINVICIAETDSILDEIKILLRFERKIRQTLRSDVTFAPGKCGPEDFKETGKAAVRAFINDLIQVQQGYPLQYEGQQLTITIKTVGYTDSQRFKPGTAFEKQFPQGLVPPKEPERSQWLNQKLSECRARTVNDFAREILEAHDWGEFNIKFSPKIVGKGEEFPPDKDKISPEYRPIFDHRRRISKISALFKREEIFRTGSCFSGDEISSPLFQE